MSKTYLDPVPKPEGARGYRARIHFTAVERTLRDGPGQNYRDVGTLKNGDLVTRYDMSRRSDTQTWHWIECEKGNGWLCTDLIQFESVMSSETTTVTAIEMPAVIEEPARRSQKELMRLLAVKFTEMAILMHQLADTEA